MPPTIASVTPSAALIAKYGRPGPRYTSYPAVPYWPAEYPVASWREALADLGREALADPSHGVSLYVHVPFCEKRCLFCACNVVVTRKHDRGPSYIDTVRREIDDVADAIGDVRLRVGQMHWGGGTPTWLTSDELRALQGAVMSRFDLLPDREQSIEVDPRVTTFEQLDALRELGVNRISMGVQDTDPAVQRAIARHQSVAQTAAIVTHARELGIDGITVDIIYGLPEQTLDSFRRTIDTVIELGVDRVAVYNFAYLPERVKHQRAIDPAALPDADTRVELMCTASERFAAAGYEMIGMDHFARLDDELARARRDGTMQRNFMGYTTRAGQDLLAFGASAISRVGRDFAQNAKTATEYAELVDAGRSPVVAGMRLSDDDVLRESVIAAVMCYGEVDLGRIAREHGVDLLASGRARLAIEALQGDGLVRWRGETLVVTDLGRYFVRNVAMTFDAYLDGPAPTVASAPTVRFSATV